jgi:hypothetical protein
LGASRDLEHFTATPLAKENPARALGFPIQGAGSDGTFEVHTAFKMPSGQTTRQLMCADPLVRK